MPSLVKSNFIKSWKVIKETFPFSSEYRTGLSARSGGLAGREVWPFEGRRQEENVHTSHQHRDGPQEATVPEELQPRGKCSYTKYAYLEKMEGMDGICTFSHK